MVQKQGCWPNCQGVGSRRKVPPHKGSTLLVAISLSMFHTVKHRAPSPWVSQPVTQWTAVRGCLKHQKVTTLMHFKLLFLTWVIDSMKPEEHIVIMLTAHIYAAHLADCHSFCSYVALQVHSFRVLCTVICVQHALDVLNSSAPQILGALLILLAPFHSPKQILIQKSPSASFLKLSPCMNNFLWDDHPFLSLSSAVAGHHCSSI